MSLKTKSGATVAQSRQDFTAERIQGTNDYSIVSKQSVERLYWSKQSPGLQATTASRHIEFFKPFVERPQRRSPAINRGYWTRMEAITRHIEHIISETSCTKKVIINLGCGYDPYPFQYLASHSTDNVENIVFLDIDYPDLVRKKINMVENTPEISSIIGKKVQLENHFNRSKNNEGVMFASTSYIAVGCDLTLLKELSELLRSLFDESDTLFAFTAEVSITYMPGAAADNLIEWSSKFSHSRFVLLEQIIPSGPDHPFANTMLKHFSKLNTPLNSVLTYQTLADQQQRFLSRGWKLVQAADMHQFFEKSISIKEKQFLDTVEAFDEWEEFIVYAQHYLILFASTDNTPSPLIDLNLQIFPILQETKNKYLMNNKPTPELYTRFAAGSLFDDSTLIQNGGYTTMRTNDSAYITTLDTHKFSLEKPPFRERMCHSIDKLPNGDLIMVGGRLSPTSYLKDCWTFTSNKWTQLCDLPDSRYRHSSFVSDCGSFYVFGGNLTTSNSWLQLASDGTWSLLKQEGDDIPNLVSAALAFNRTKNEGFIFGGMKADYSPNFKTFKFYIKNGLVEVRDVSKKIENKIQLSLTRYGAKALYLDDDNILLCGGVSQQTLIHKTQTFVNFNTTDFTATSDFYKLDDNSYLPLLSGFNVDMIKKDIIIYGGGGVCFSFGAFWNDLTILSNSSSKDFGKYDLITPPKLLAEKVESMEAKPKRTTSGYKKIKIKPVPRFILGQISNFKIFFEEFYAKTSPIVLEKVPTGPSSIKWKDHNNLIQDLGVETEIEAIISTTQKLNLSSKDNEHKCLSFEKFFNILDVSKPSSEMKVAFEGDMSTIFKAVSNDFTLPSPLQNLQSFLTHPRLQVLSSGTTTSLQINPRFTMVCQVTGKSRIRLYPSSNTPKLQIPQGELISKLENVFDTKNSILGGTKPLESIMSSGEVVLIPELWVYSCQIMAPSIVVEVPIVNDLNQAIE